MTLMMELSANIPLFDSATNTTSTAITLIALAAHPTFSRLLYTLYSHTSNQQYHILTWQTLPAGHNLLGNITLNNFLGCTMGCIMEVSNDLLLVQSGSQAFLYILDINSKAMLNPTVERTFRKTNQFFQYSDIFKEITIQNASSIHFTGTTLEIIIFDLAQPPNPETRVLQIFSFKTTSNGSPLGVTTNQEIIVWASNNSAVNIGFVCLPCILSGSLGNNRILSQITIFPTTHSASFKLKMALGKSSSGQNMLWLNPNNQAYRYLIPKLTTANNSTQLLPQTPSVTQIQAINNTSITLSSANNHFAYFHEGQSYTFRNYSTTANSLVSNGSQNQPVNRIKSTIHANSQLISISNITQVIQQFQLVSNCSLYKANLTAQGCQCYQYDGIFCELVSPGAIIVQEQSSSFPIYWIILIVLVSIVVIVIIVVLCICSQRSKPAERTPYKYQMIDLMSFQV